MGIGSLAALSAEQEDGDSDSDSEKEDDIIKPEDNLIIVGHVEGDASILEVYSKLIDITLYFCDLCFTMHIIMYSI